MTIKPSKEKRRQRKGLAKFPYTLVITIIIMLRLFSIIPKFGEGRKSIYPKLWKRIFNKQRS